MTPHTVGSQMCAQGGQVEELFGLEAGFYQATGVILEADGRMEDHVADQTVLLEPQLVANDAVLSRTSSGPQGGKSSSSGGGGDGGNCCQLTLLGQVRPDG